MRWLGIPILLLGVAIGVVARNAWTGTEERALPFGSPSIEAATDPTAFDSVRIPPQPQRQDSQLLQDRLAGLEAKLSSVESRLAASAQSDPAAQPTPLGGLEDKANVSMEERLRLARERVSRIQAERLDEFNHEGVDPTWAAEAGRAIEAELAGSEKRAHGFSAKVECRSTRCLAKLTWPDFETAKKEFLAGSLPGSSCAQFVNLEPPANEKEVYTANILYNCENTQFRRN